MRLLKSLVIASAATTGCLRFALRRKSRPPMILMYHGVTEKRVHLGLQNYEGKHLARKNFVEHLHILRRSCRTISLQEMVEGLHAGEDLNNTVALTFDDGYENNFLVAAPLLKDFKLPATFFLATGLIGQDRFIWPDIVEIALDRTEQKELRYPGLETAMPLGSLKEKQQTLVALKKLLKQQPMENFTEILENLVQRLDVRLEVPHGDYRFMNWDQVRNLVATGFEVGAHTVTHPILSNIPFESAAKEVLESRDAIINEAGQCSLTFCYPNGKASDYTTELQDFCKKHFTAALSTNRGVARLSEITELKRLSPPDNNFGRSLEWTLLVDH